MCPARCTSSVATPFFLFFFFILGAIVASFVGVVSVRLNTSESIARGRSRCDACGAPLTSIDLVPIISYAVFGGRARCCRARISLFSPLSEVVLGALFALSYATFGLVPALVPLLGAIALLMLLVLYDLAHMILPPVPLALFVLASGLFAWLVAPTAESFFIVVGLAFVLGAFIWLLHVLSRGRAMGFADAPLTLGLALLAGPSALAGFVYAFWIGAVLGIVLLVQRPRGSRMGVEVPFAPYLAAGFLLALFTPWNPFALIQALL